MVAPQVFARFPGMWQLRVGADNRLPRLSSRSSLAAAVTATFARDGRVQQRSCLPVSHGCGAPAVKRIWPRPVTE